MTRRATGRQVDYVWYVWEKQPDGKITYKQM